MAYMASSGTQMNGTRGKKRIRRSCRFLCRFVCRFGGDRNMCCACAHLALSPVSPSCAPSGVHPLIFAVCPYPVSLILPYLLFLHVLTPSLLPPQASRTSTSWATSLATQSGSTSLGTTPSEPACSCPAAASRQRAHHVTLPVACWTPQQQGLARALPGGVLLKSCAGAGAYKLALISGVVQCPLIFECLLTFPLLPPPAVTPPPEPLCPATAAPWRSAGGAGT